MENTATVGLPNTPQPVPTPTTSSAPKMHTPDQCCKSGGCETCLKGGMPMKKEILSVVVLVLIGVVTILSVLLIKEKRESLGFDRDEGAEERTVSIAATKLSEAVPPPKAFSRIIELPQPKLKGSVSVEAAMQSRRSQRLFTQKALSQAELSQVLWSAQGVTDEKGHRTAPSAHSLYPFTVYVVVRNVTGITPGLYAYLPETHSLGDLGLANAGEMLTAAGVQDGAQKAPAVLVLSAAYGKMVKSFPDDPKSVTMLEAGHIGQNVYLQLEALKLGGVVMAGFDSAKVGQGLKLDATEEAVYLMPFGDPAPAPAASAAPATKPVEKE